MPRLLKRSPSGKVAPQFHAPKTNEQAYQVARSTPVADLPFYDGPQLGAEVGIAWQDSLGDSHGRLGVDRPSPVVTPATRDSHRWRKAPPPSPTHFRSPPSFKPPLFDHTNPDSEAMRNERDLRRIKSELKASKDTVDKQRIELESLRGLRINAGRMVTDAANERGRPLSPERVLRYSAVSKGAVDVPLYSSPRSSPTRTRSELGLGTFTSSGSLITTGGMGGGGTYIAGPRATVAAVAAGIGPSSVFHSDALVELMEQAIVESSRRVQYALIEAARCRAESEREEEKGIVMLEQAFPRRFGVEPSEAENAAKVTVRGMLAGCNRAIGKLRSALHKLEQEAAMSQSVHVADLRGLSCRLVAQREAVVQIMGEALASTESEGAFSIAGLQAEIERLKAEKSKEGNDNSELIAKLNKALADTKAALEESRAGRARDNERFNASLRALKAENAELETELRESKGWATILTAEKGVLIPEIKEEEEAHAADCILAARESAAFASEKAKLMRAAEEKLQKLREKGNNTARELQGQLRVLRNEKDAMEARLLQQLRKLEERTSHEYAMLKSRNDALQQQVITLKANSAHGRHKLYWSTLRASASEISLNRAYGSQQQRSDFGYYDFSPMAVDAFADGEEGDGSPTPWARDERPTPLSPSAPVRAQEQREAPWK